MGVESEQILHLQAFRLVVCPIDPIILSGRPGGVRVQLSEQRGACLSSQIGNVDMDGICDSIGTVKSVELAHSFASRIVVH